MAEETNKPKAEDMGEKGKKETTTEVTTTKKGAASGDKEVETDVKVKE